MVSVGFSCWMFYNGGSRTYILYLPFMAKVYILIKQPWCMCDKQAVMQLREKPYRVSHGRIMMPPDTEGKVYLRRVCLDGAVTFLPMSVAQHMTSDDVPASSILEK